MSKCMEMRIHQVQKNELFDDDERSFHNKSIAQRSVILFSGPAANFLFPFFY